jgi:hypothetical protein
MCINVLLYLGVYFVIGYLFAIIYDYNTNHIHRDNTLAIVIIELWPFFFVYTFATLTKELMIDSVLFIVDWLHSLKTKRL